VKSLMRSQVTNPLIIISHFATAYAGYVGIVGTADKILSRILVNSLLRSATPAERHSLPGTKLFLSGSAETPHRPHRTHRPHQTTV